MRIDTRYRDKQEREKERERGIKETRACVGQFIARIWNYPRKEREEIVKPVSRARALRPMTICLVLFRCGVACVSSCSARRLVGEARQATRSIRFAILQHLPRKMVIKGSLASLGTAAAITPSSSRALRRDAAIRLSPALETFNNAVLRQLPPWQAVVIVGRKVAGRTSRCRVGVSRAPRRVAPRPSSRINSTVRNGGLGSRAEISPAEGRERRGESCRANGKGIKGASSESWRLAWPPPPRRDAQPRRGKLSRDGRTAEKPLAMGKARCYQDLRLFRHLAASGTGGWSALMRRIHK